MTLLHKVFRLFISGLLLGGGAWAAPSFADALNFIGAQANVDTALNSVSDISVSPDGKFVYAAATGSAAITIFARDEDTGTLTYISKTTGSDAVTAAFSVEVSSDNKSVYAASPTGHEIVAFSRNELTGALTLVNRATNTGGTRGFVSVSTSPDGKFVYGVGGSPSGLVVFSRNAATSEISFLADYKDNVDDHALGQLFNASSSPIKNIATSADSRFVYVTSTQDHAVTLFSRDAITGLLTQIAVYKDGVDGVDGLQAASSTKISPDGKNLYVSGQSENSVAIFSINSTSGELTYLAKVTNGVDGVMNMLGARSLAISPDGKYVLVSAITSDTVTAFLRDETTGLLTFDSAAQYLVNGVTGLDGPSGMATDSLNQHLYVAGQNTSSIVVFSLPTPAVRLSVNTQTASESGPAIILDDQLLVSDSDSPNLVSATVSIAAGFISTDLLAVQTLPGIVAAYDSQTGVLSLNGVAPLADYQAVLRSLTYRAGVDATLTVGDTSERTISFMVSDGENRSALSSIVVTVEKPDLLSVTFVDWDSTVIDTQQVSVGAAAVAPASPSRTGYTFTGWDVTFDNITTALTVQAQYSINSYTLTFDSNGGSPVSAITADFESTVTPPAAPIRAGYIFAGWSPVVPATMPAANTTLTAQWTVNAYTLSFDSAGGSAVASASYDFGAAVATPASPTREGYTFAGWSPVVPATMPAANASVTAQWTVNAYTLSFDSAGGSAVAPASYDFGAAVATPASPTREGYTFTGWSPVVPATMPAANASVTAQWTVNAYTLSFDTAGGSAVAPASYDFGAAVATPASPTREGHTFAGWSPVVPATMPAANASVTAQWTVNAYTLSFDTAGGSAVASASYDFGAAVAAPVSPTREGYTFAGWSPVVPATMPASNASVTAQWTVNAYTLSFDTAGGSAVASASYDFGAAVAAPVSPTREGYTFAGWSPVVPATMPASNASVTAQWTVNAYTLSFDTAGGSAIAPASYGFGAAVATPASPTREGYTFAGWNPVVPTTMPAQNLVLTAVYDSIPLTVTATVSGEASISPATQQVNSGNVASFELSLANADDVVVLSGSCQASVSGNLIVTSAINQACTVAVTVYPSTKTEKDTEAALASNGTSRFSFATGAGDKILTDVTVLRSGVESELELTDAEALITKQADGSYIFSAQRTGRYSLNFVDAVSGEWVQVVYNVFPYLAFTSSQQPVQQDVATTVRVWLSDEPVEYPVTATILKDGVATELEQVEFTAEHNLLRSYTVTAAATTARLTLQAAGLGNALAGTPAVHNLAVQQAPPALALTAKATQNNVETYVVDQAAGLVTLSVSELNATEANYSWTASGLTLQTSGATASFDPATLATGRHLVTVTAVSANGRTGQFDMALRVVAGCPVESCAGAGSSGIPAAENNFAATQNRIPLCPNVLDENRVGSCKVDGAGALYAEAPNQYQLTLGALTEEQSWVSGQFGIALNDQMLPDIGFVQQGTVVNFDVSGLEHPGEVVPVAIPLIKGAVIPANAVWRKYIQGHWQDFVVDSANHIDSAARDLLGQCPGVSSNSWTTGLTEGHGCVRLSIEDGGPNDDDGVANSVIRDPGVLAVAEEVVTPEPPLPEPPKDVTVKSGGGSMGGILSLLLAGLAAFRVRKALAAAVLLPLSVSAQDLYVGVDAMDISSDTGSAEVTRALNAAGITGTATVEDKSRTGFRIYAGYQFTEVLSVELGWLDAGDVTTRVSGVPATTEASDLKSIWPTSGAGAELSLVVQPVTIAERFKPGIRVGLWQMEVKDKVLDSSDVSRLSHTERVPFIELLGEVELNSSWSLKLGVSHYQVDNADFRTAQLGLRHHF